MFNNHIFRKLHNSLERIACHFRRITCYSYRPRLLDKRARSDFEKNPEAFDDIRSSIVKYFVNYEALSYCDDLLKELTVEFFKRRRRGDRLCNGFVLSSHGRYTNEDIDNFVGAIVVAAVTQTMESWASGLKSYGPTYECTPELNYAD